MVAKNLVEIDAIRFSPACGLTPFEGRTVSGSVLPLKKGVYRSITESGVASLHPWAWVVLGEARHCWVRDTR